MIERAWFKNFKLLGDVSLDLSQLNVLVGRNGIGKTSVLEAMEIVVHLAEAVASNDPLSGLSKACRPLADLKQSLGHRSDARLEMGCDLGRRFALDALLTPPKTLQQSKLMPDLQLEMRHGQSRVFGGRFPYGSNTGVNINDSSVELRALLGRTPLTTRTLRLDSRALAAANYSDDEVPTMGLDGAGLASLLQYLQGARDARMEAIEQDLRRIVPTTRRIRTLPARIQQRRRIQMTVEGKDASYEQEQSVTGARFEIEFDGVGWIPAEQVSEGTLLALGLITALRYDPPSLLLLDDIDKGLHPMAQQELIRLLRDVLSDKPDVQVIATSHSPFVLDELEGHEAFVVGAVSQTESRIRRLDEHPAWESRKAYLDAGAFWSAVGEDWVAKDAT